MGGLGIFSFQINDWVVNFPLQYSNRWDFYAVMCRYNLHPASLMPRQIQMTGPEFKTKNAALSDPNRV
jgi:hypothetical protein